MIAVELGWLMMSSIMMMNVASSGARFFASQRGTATPYTDTNKQITAAASYLNQSSLSYSTAVGNVSCSDNGSCAVELTNAVKAGLEKNASVTVTYAYRPLTGSLTNLLSKSLSATVVARVL